VLAGGKFRAAVGAEKPLQVAGAINAYTARLAEATGFRALYLSGGGVAANSLGMPDLGISTMEDVLTDVRRITDASGLPLLVDIDTGWGGAFNIARAIRSMIKAGAAAVHMEDQVGAKRCGHRPGKELVPADEMVDRIKAAVDARTDENFVLMARTDALANEGLAAAIERAQAYVAAGADMIFAEAVTELSQRASERGREYCVCRVHSGLATFRFLWCPSLSSSFRPWRQSPKFAFTRSTAAPGSESAIRRFPPLASSRSKAKTSSRAMNMRRVSTYKLNRRKLRN
jgi:methylisocitrate lyase